MQLLGVRSQPFPTGEAFRLVVYHAFIGGLAAHAACL